MGGCSGGSTLLIGARKADDVPGADPTLALGLGSGLEEYPLAGYFIRSPAHELSLYPENSPSKGQIASAAHINPDANLIVAPNQEFWNKQQFPAR